MKPLGLYHFRRAKGGLNFGDDLSPILLSYASGRDVKWASELSCDIFGIGSILHRTQKPKFRILRGLRSRKPALVWGSGFAEKTPVVSDRFLSPIALRGTLTADAFGSPDVPLGDPGLLAGEWFQERQKTHKFGVVPHYVDKEHPALLAFLDEHPDCLNISVERDPETVLRDISRCEIVLSSSMHGLIIADAFNIPNFKVSFSGKIKGGQNKFDDYASAVKRTDIKDISLSSFKADQAAGSFDSSHFACIHDVCHRLKKALVGAL